MRQYLSRFRPIDVAIFAALLVVSLFHAPAAVAMGAPIVGFSGTTTLISDMQNVLKIVFNEPFFDNVVADSEFGDVFEEGGGIKYDETTGGRYVENLHELAWPAGVGARLDDDYIPQADPPQYANSRVYLKRVMGTIQMSSAVMDRVKTNEGAYLDYMERALPMLQKRVTAERDRMILGWGYAVKAQIDTVSAMNVPATGQFQVVVKNAMGVTGYSEGILQFIRGERNVFTSSLTAAISLRNAGTTQSAVVSNVDVNTNTITYTGVVGLQSVLAAGDYIGAGDNAGSSFPAGSPAETKELTGVLAAVDDGSIVSTYMNIARAGNNYWQSQMIDSQATPFNGALTEKLLVYADRQNTVIGGGIIDLLIVNRVGEEQYWDSLKNDRQFVNPTGDYEGGKGKMTIRLNGRQLELKVARKQPIEIAFGIQRDSFKCFRLREWFWDDRTGSIWNRVVDSTGYKSAYFATGYFWEEIFCGAPQKNFRINSLLNLS